MSSSVQIMAGAAYINLSLRDAQVAQGLGKTQKKLSAFAAAAQKAFVGMNLWSSQCVNTLMLMNGVVSSTIRKFGQLDTTTRSFIAITGSSLSQMGKFQDQFKQIALATGYLQQEIADTAVVMGRLGLSAKEVQDGLHPMLNLVRATNSPVSRIAEVAEHAGAALRIFNLDSTEMTRIVDVMAYASNRSATDVFALGESLKMAGPSAHSLGEDIEDVTAALMLFANAGIKGSLAGTALRKIYQSLAVASKSENLTPEEEAEGISGLEQLRDLGIQVRDKETGNLRKAADIMYDLADAVGRMKTGERVNFATDVFDLRGSLGALSILNNPALLEQFRQGLANSAGTAKDAADKINDGVTKMLNNLRTSFEELQKSFGAFAFDTMAPLLEIFMNVSNAFSRFVEQNHGVIKTFLQATISIVALGAALKGVFGIFALFKMALAPFQGLQTVFSSIFRVLSGGMRKEAELAKANALIVTNTEAIKTAARKKAVAEKKALEMQAKMDSANANYSQNLATLNAEKQKLAAIQQNVKQTKMAEDQKLASVRSRCAQELSAERAKLNQIKAAQSAIKGGRGPDMAQKRAELRADLAATKARIKNIRTVAQAQANARAANIKGLENEARQQQVVVNKQTKRVVASGKAAAAVYQQQANAQNNLTAATNAYNATTGKAITKESALNAVKAMSIHRDKMRGKLLVSLMAKKKLSYVLNQKHRALILKTSFESLVAAMREKAGIDATTASLWAKVIAMKAAAAAGLVLAGVLQFLSANWVTIAFMAIVTVIGMIRSNAEEASQKLHDMVDAAKEARDAATQRAEDRKNQAVDEEKEFRRYQQLRDKGKRSEEEQNEFAQLRGKYGAFSSFGDFAQKQLDTRGKELWNILGKAIEAYTTAKRMEIQHSDGSNEDERIKFHREAEEALREVNNARSAYDEYLSIAGTIAPDQDKIAKMYQRHKHDSRQTYIPSRAAHADLAAEALKYYWFPAPSRRLVLNDAEKLRYAQGTSLPDLQASRTEKEEEEIQASAQKLADAQSALDETLEEFEESSRSQTQNDIRDLDEKIEQTQRYIALLETANRDTAKWSNLIAGLNQQKEDLLAQEAAENLEMANWVSQFEAERNAESQRQSVFDEFSRLMERKDYSPALLMAQQWKGYYDNLYRQKTAEYSAAVTGFQEPQSEWGASFSEKEIDALEKLKEEIENLISHGDKWTDRVTEVQDAMNSFEERKNVTEVIGSWSLSALQRMIGLDGGALERTAAATEASAKYLRQTQKGIDSLNEKQIVWG